MKTLLFTLSFFYITVSLSAQEQIIYFSDDFKPVYLKTASYRIAEFDSTGEFHGDFSDYIGRKLFAEGSYTHSKLHGPVIRYNTFGDTIIKGEFYNGEPFGDWYFYEKNQLVHHFQIGHGVFRCLKFISQGKNRLDEEGNGVYKITTPDFKIKGSVHNYQLEGKWVKKYRYGYLKEVVEFEKGKIVEFYINYEKEGNEFDSRLFLSDLLRYYYFIRTDFDMPINLVYNPEFNSLYEELAQIIGADQVQGLKAVRFKQQKYIESADEFRSYIQRNLIYPTEAAVQGISGNVIVQFEIDTAGNVFNVKAIKGVHPSLDKEAIRVVESSPT